MAGPGSDRGGLRRGSVVIARGASSGPRLGRGFELLPALLGCKLGEPTAEPQEFFLTHSSVAQYSSFPRIPLSAVQPGDLVYYGNYGPHIAIYVGGGQIIHASSPAPGGQTRIDSMYGYDEPWGAVRVA